MSQNPSLIDAEGWYLPARRVPSPYYNQRPENEKISLLVVHGISLPPGEFGGDGIDRLFCGQLDPNAHPYFAQIYQLQVSAHLLIRRDGAVVQYVPFSQRAWHAGASHFAGRDGCNDFSIGIELEGTDTIPYTQEQYQQLAQVTAALQRHYPQLTAERIVGHSDVAPGRKSDPGEAFEWGRFRQLLNEMAERVEG